MATVFLSHARVDRLTAEMLGERLRVEGFAPWVDRQAIEGGERWTEAIDAAIRSAVACVVLVTPRALTSDWVRREVRIAADAGIPTIPVRIHPDANPGATRALGLEDLQVVDLVGEGFEPGFTRLKRALDRSRAASARHSGVPALVVEDHPFQAAATRGVLETMGLEVTVAASFDEAARRLRSEGYRLVLLDMQLDPLDAGGQQGLLLLDLVRVHQPRAAVIVVSALPWSGRDVRDFLVRKGASDFLAKPFDPDALRAAVEATLTPR